MLYLANELARNIGLILIVATGLENILETEKGVTVYTDKLEIEAIYDAAMQVGVATAIAMSNNPEHNNFTIGCFVEGLERVMNF